MKTGCIFAFLLFLTISLPGVICPVEKGGKQSDNSNKGSNDEVPADVQSEYNDFERQMEEVNTVLSKDVEANELNGLKETEINNLEEMMDKVESELNELKHKKLNDDIILDLYKKWKVAKGILREHKVLGVTKTNKAAANPTDQVITIQKVDGVLDTSKPEQQRKQSLKGIMNAIKTVITLSIRAKKPSRAAKDAKAPSTEELEKKKENVMNAFEFFADYVDMIFEKFGAEEIEKGQCQQNNDAAQPGKPGGGVGRRKKRCIGYLFIGLGYVIQFLGYILIRVLWWMIKAFGCFLTSAHWLISQKGRCWNAIHAIGNTAVRLEEKAAGF